MEEWRQCGRWLIDCKVLPPNHRVVWPSAVVFDLAQALRDGVLLCQLLHNLSPGSIDLKDINFRPQMSQVGRGGGRGSVGLFVVLAQKFVARVDGAGLCRCLHRLLGSRTAGLNRCGGTTGTGWGGIRPRERRKLLPRIYIIRKQKQLSVLRAA